MNAQDRSFPPKDRHAVVIRNCGLGDFILSLPALSALRHQYDRITLVTWGVTSYTGHKEEGMKYAASMPWFDLVSGLVDDIQVIPQHQKLRSLHKTARSLDQTSSVYFLAPASSESWTSRLLKWVFIKAAFLTHSVKFDKVAFRFSEGPQPQFEQMLEMALGRAINPSDRISYPKRVMSYLNPQLAQDITSMPTRGYIVMATQSIRKHKQWSSSCFKEIARRIFYAYKMQIYLIGSDFDTTSIENEYEDIILEGVAVVATGDLNTSLTLIKNSELFIGNDGGAAHLTSFTSAPSIIITSGILEKNEVIPWGENKIVVTHTTKCSPCGNQFTCPLGTQECLAGVSVDRVYQEVVANLRRGGEG